MKYNFDHITSRAATNALSVEGYRKYLFGHLETVDIPFENQELIRMWVADMEFTSPPEVLEAIKDKVDHGVFGYTKVFDNHYYQTFTNWTQSRYGWRFPAEQLLTSSGVIPALYDLVELTCQPEDKMLILTPSYALFNYAASAKNLEVVSSDLLLKDGQYYIDFDDIEQKVQDHRLKVFIHCSPHNPTGRLWSTSELKRLGDICFRHNVLVISDEIHCDLLRQEKQFTPMASLFPDSDQLITCMSPSKSFNLAGFLLANIIVPNETIREKWLKKNLGLVNPLSLTAAQAAYQLGGPWLEALTQYLDQNFKFLQTYLSDHLPKAKFSIPDATYFGWIDVSAYFPHTEQIGYFFAREAGVLLEDGGMFVANAKGYIRLNLACPRSRLEEGLQKIVNSISKAS